MYSNKQFAKIMAALIILAAVLFALTAKSQGIKIDTTYKTIYDTAFEKIITIHDTTIKITPAPDTIKSFTVTQKKKCTGWFIFKNCTTINDTTWISSIVIKQPIDSVVRTQHDSIISIIISSTVMVFDTTYTTTFGVFINSSSLNDGSMKNKINIMKSLGVQYSRVVLRIDKPNDFVSYTQLTDSDFKVCAVLDWGTTSTAAVPFPTDTVLFKSNLTTLLNNLKSKPPELCVLMREPTNLEYHSGDIKQYVVLLRITTTLCHQYGFKIADGGLHPPGLLWYSYQDYLARGLTDSANLAKALFKSNALNYLNQNPRTPDDNKAFGDYLQRVQVCLDGYKDIPLDYVNAHVYDPANFTSPDINKAVNYNLFTPYYRNYTGKNVISDACSITNYSDNLLNTHLEGLMNAGYAYAFYFSSNDNLSEPLCNTDGTINSLGNIFKIYIK